MPRVSKTDELAEEICARLPSTGRSLVALAGPPGAGKSTLAERLASHLGPEAAVLPMDGFHLDNETLYARGLFARKGAPDTFDVAGFAACLKALKEANGPVFVPTFDRAADAVVPNGAVISADARIILVEGNYLLLDTENWRALHPLWELRVLIDVARPVLHARLVSRWLDHGLSQDAARRRAEENDLVNADTVRLHSIAPDILFSV